MQECQGSVIHPHSRKCSTIAIEREYIENQDNLLDDVDVLVGSQDKIGIVIIVKIDTSAHDSEKE
ncbi:hypothetical protein MAP00_005318 [Monascus purpureus]|nr:hypothetical protein MAP00_005318 [Monascus purpureus]